MANLKMEVRGSDLNLLYGWLLVDAEKVLNSKSIEIELWIPGPAPMTTTLRFTELLVEETNYKSRSYLVLINDEAATLTQLQQLGNFIPNPLLGMVPL